MHTPFKIREQLNILLDQLNGLKERAAKAHYEAGQSSGSEVKEKCCGGGCCSAPKVDETGESHLSEVTSILQAVKNAQDQEQDLVNDLSAIRQKFSPEAREKLSQKLGMLPALPLAGPEAVRTIANLCKEVEQLREHIAEADEIIANLDENNAQLGRALAHLKQTISESLSWVESRYRPIDPAREPIPVGLMVGIRHHALVDLLHALKDSNVISYNLDTKDMVLNEEDTEEGNEFVGIHYDSNLEVDPVTGDLFADLIPDEPGCVSPAFGSAEEHFQYVAEIINEDTQETFSVEDAPAIQDAPKYSLFKIVFPQTGNTKTYTGREVQDWLDNLPTLYMKGHTTPFKFMFNTMIRKLWYPHEIQIWLDCQPQLYLVRS